MKGSKANNNPSNTKQSKNPRDIIPPNFLEIRKLNPIIKSEDTFNIKKNKKVKDYLQIFEDFPEWPNQEEIEVKKIKNKTKL